MKRLLAPLAILMTLIAAPSCQGEKADKKEKPQHQFEENVTGASRGDPAAKSQAAKESFEEALLSEAGVEESEMTMPMPGEKFLDRVMARFDDNGDGALTRTELDDLLLVAKLMMKNKLRGPNGKACRHGGKKGKQGPHGHPKKDKGDFDPVAWCEENPDVKPDDCAEVLAEAAANDLPEDETGEDAPAE